MNTRDYRRAESHLIAMVREARGSLTSTELAEDTAADLNIELPECPDDHWLYQLALDVEAWWEDGGEFCDPDEESMIAEQAELDSMERPRPDYWRNEDGEYRLG